MGYDREENRIVISFRGSHNLKNWLEDFEFKEVSYPYCDRCLVHLGN